MKTGKEKNSQYRFLILFVFAFLVWCVPKVSQAQLIAHEGFDYPTLNDGESIANANGGTGWVEPWNSAITAAEGSYQVNGLSYNTLKNEGGCVKWVTSSGQYSRSYDATIGGTVDLSSGGTAWFSYIIRFDDGVPANARTLFFTGTGGGSNKGIGAEFTGTGQIMGRITGNLGTASTKTCVIGNGTTPGDSVLIIGKITYGGTTTGNTTTVDLWMDPADYSSEVALGTADATHSRDGADLGTHSFGNETGVWLRFQDGSTLVDEIRVGLILDDVTPIASPTIDPIPDQGQVYDNAGPQTVELTGISDGLGGISEITIDYASDNQTVIPDGNISLAYTSPNTTGTLTYEPVVGTGDFVNITLTLSSDAPAVTTESFQVEVLNSTVNHEPTIDTIYPLTVQVDEATKTINLSGITDGDLNLTQNLTVSAISSQGGIITIDDLDYTSDDPTGTLTLGITGTEGYSDITVTVQDDGGLPEDDTKTMTFRVTAIPPIVDEWSDQFDGPDLNTGWNENSGSYDLSWEDGTMRIDFNKKSWSAFVLDLDGIYDFTNSPYFNLNVKTTNPFKLTAYFEDINGKKFLNDVRVHSSEQMHNYYLNILEGNGSDEFRVDSVVGMIFIFNGNNDNNYSGTAWFDNLLVGNAATPFANARVIPNLELRKNGSAMFYITDIENATDVSAPVSTDLLENINLSSISYIDEFEKSMSVLTFDAKTDLSGIDTIPLVVTGSTNYENHMYNCIAYIEQNIAPTINELSDQDFEINTMKAIKLSGISDGNSMSEQTLEFTVTSSDQNVIRDQDIEIIYEQGSRNGMLEITPISTGSNISITITVDDGGDLNNTKSITFIADVYENLNYPPTIDLVNDQFTALPEGAKTIELTGIGDGNQGTQELTFSATSTDQLVIPDDNIIIDYTSGSTATLTYTPVGHGATTITVTLTDDNAGTGNGIQSTSISFVVNVAEFPLLTYYTEDFDNVDPYTYNSPEFTLSIVDSTEFSAIKVDCQNKNVWGGLWLDLIPPIDLTDHPYLSMEIYPVEEDLSFWMWFWDETNTNGGRRNNSVGAFDKSEWTTAGQWNEVVFDFSAPGEMADNNGDLINTKNIRQVLFNMHNEEQSWPWPPSYTGTFYIRNLRVGSEAIIPKPLIESIPGQTIFDDAGEQSVEVVVNYPATALSASSSDQSVVSDDDINIPATADNVVVMTYSPSGLGNTNIKILANNGERTDSVIFRVDVVNTNPSLADTILINPASEYQVFRGIGNCNAGNRYTFDSKVDMGMSALRIGMYGDGRDDGIENVNDNDDPYVLNRDALNYGAYDWDAYRDLVERAGIESVYLTFWSPPAWMKTNLSGAYGYPAAQRFTEETDNRLAFHYYEEFAELVYATVMLFKEEAGIELTAVTLQNEPSFHEPYGSAILDPKYYAILTEVVGNRLAAEGLSTKVAGAEQVFLQPSNPVVEYMDSVINRPVADMHTMAFAYHGYDVSGTISETPDTTWFRIFKNKAEEANYPKELWMTEGGNVYEHAGGTGGEELVGTYKGVMANVTGLVGTLEYGDVSLFSYLGWDGNFFDGSVINQNFHATKQVVRHIRPGMKRISSHINSNNLRVTSFKSDTSIVTVVICRDQSTTIKLDGSDIPQVYDVYQTTEKLQHEYMGLYNKDGVFKLPPQSITTFVSKNITSNKAPVFNNIDNFSHQIENGDIIISITGISDGDENLEQNLTLTAQSDNESIALTSVDYIPNNSTAELTISPVSSGIVHITVSLQDDGGTANGGIDKTSKTFTIDLTTTSIDELDAGIKIYPNPANNERINISLNSGQLIETVKVYDLTGMLVNTHSIAEVNQCQINLSDLASGTYILEVVSGGKSIRRLFVVE